MLYASTSNQNYHDRSILPMFRLCPHAYLEAKEASALTSWLYLLSFTVPNLPQDTELGDRVGGNLR